MTGLTNAGPNWFLNAGVFRNLEIGPWRLGLEITTGRDLKPQCRKTDYDSKDKAKNEPAGKLNSYGIFWPFYGEIIFK